MQGKDTVVLRTKYIHLIEKLSDVQAGMLFKHLMRYVNDQDPEAPNPLIEIAWIPIETDLKADLVKWKKRCEINRKNASNKRNRTASESQRMGSDSDYDSDSDSDNDNDNENKPNGLLFYRELKSNKKLKLTFDEMNRLLKKYPKEAIDEMLDKVENFKKNKKYNSLNLTVQNWLKKEFKNGSGNYTKNESRKPSAIDNLNKSLGIHE